MRSRIPIAAIIFLLLGSSAGLLPGCATEDPVEPAVTGSISIDATPDALLAPWTLEGPGGDRRTGSGDQELADMPTGVYAISWGDVSDYRTPNDASATLQADRTVTFSGLYVLEAAAGTIGIDTSPDDPLVPWSLAGPDGYETSGNGDTTLSGLATGPYTITWQTIAGWIEPAPETAVMPTESGLVFTGTYVAAPSAWSLTISPEPEGIHAPWSLAGPGGFFESGVGARTVIVGTRGLYTATWENVPGWLTPEPLAVDLGIDADVTLSSAYTEQPSASTVVVNPVPGTLMAPWRVDGPGGLVRTGNGYARLTDMPIGLYSVSWEAVYGWNEPAGSTQTLAVNGTITFDGIYEVQETGTVVIDPDPDTLNAGWTLTGPDSSYSGTGNGDTTLQDMALGTYRVDWEVIPDLVTPPSTELVLAADQTITFHGEYVTGTVMIDVDITPDNGSAAWTLRGPGGFEATGSSDRTFAPMPPGEYSVEWADLLFWTTPTTPPMTLTPNGTITFTGRYIGGTLNVDTEPDALSGMWTVVGSHETRTGSGDATLLDLPPTDYTVTWDSIPGWFTPLPEHVDFWDFPVASVQGVYAKGAILIDPEPDALNASWSLAGPDGFTADGSGDELVADLAPGVYSVTWGVVAGWIAPSAQTLYYTDSPDTLHVVGTYVEN